MGIYYPVRLVNPWYVDGTFGVTNKQKLHTGANINQQRSRIFVD
jgi:hypothetical protein